MPDDDVTESPAARLPAVRTPANPPAVTDKVEQAGHVALGAVLLVGDGLGAVFRKVSARPESVEPAPPSAAVAVRRVVVGLSFATQRRVSGAAEATAKVVMPTASWIASSPLLAPAVRRVADELDRAYRAGLTEEEAARELASRTGEVTVGLAVPLVLDEIDLEPVIERVLGDLDLKPIIERVMGQLDLPVIVEQVMDDLDLDPIVQRVLSQLDLSTLINDVMGQLEMTNVVMQATGGITDDALEAVRNRSADGDALVERIVAKVLRRKVAELPPVGELTERAQGRERGAGPSGREREEQ